MSRKLFPARIYLSAAAMLTDLAEHSRVAQASFGVSLFDMLHDNLPVLTDETGTYSSLNPDEAGLPVLDDTALTSVGTLAIVPLYTDTEIAQQDADPALLPRAFYVLSLPKVTEIIGDAKLADYRRALIERDLLARAKAIATRHDKDPAAAPLIRDRISALIAVAGRNTAASAEKSFIALFPLLQAAILSNIGKKVDALKAVGHHAQARLVAATFSKARLNRDTMKACLSSTDAAKINFPALPQSSWVSLLNFAVAYCPKHQAKKRVTDDAGNVVKDAEGKVVYTREAMPLAPTIFQQWLATRDEQTAAAPELGIDLSDMGFTAPDASAA